MHVCVYVDMYGGPIDVCVIVCGKVSTLIEGKREIIGCTTNEDSGQEC